MLLYLCIADSPTLILPTTPTQVELHERGTRITIRSMLSLVNSSPRFLAVDLDMPNAPHLHLGVLSAGASMAISEDMLRGGLRLTDLGVPTGARNSEPGSAAGGDAQLTQQQIAAALDAADAAEATGRFVRPVIWLPSLMRSEDSSHR